MLTKLIIIFNKIQKNNMKDKAPSYHFVNRDWKSIWLIRIDFPKLSYLLQKIQYIVNTFIHK